ncbi:MAG: ankyrin repeat domain-containing protein [Burkholderiales bacterium]|nr:ankyrin repeat domain-containing protein [Burkholderiales bacterium]
MAAAFPVTAMDARDFGAVRSPFLPRLVADDDPELCSIVLALARRTFLSGDSDMWVNRVDGNGIRWVPWEDQTASEDSARGPIRSIELDLDGTGTKQTLALRHYFHTWRGENYYAFVFPSKGSLESVIKDPKADSDNGDTAESRLPADPGSLDPGIRYYPDGETTTGEAAEGSEWEDHQLFEFRGRYYFYGYQHWLHGPLQRSLPVYRLQGNGRLKPACRVQMWPMEDRVAAADSVEGVAGYFGVLRRIGTGGVGDCGTMHANDIHDWGAEFAMMNAIIRPWTLSERRREGSAKLERTLMADWSFAGVWNRREYQTLLEHEPSALQGLERHFQKAFGLKTDNARRQAKLALDQIVAAWIMVPGSYGDFQTVDPFRQRIIQGTLTKSDIVESGSPKEEGRDDQLIFPVSPYLHDAVESSSIAKSLLDAGFRVDARNDFGKTALMMAAHMNRPDVVALLLRRKAAVDARTKEVNQCGMQINRSGRTALMYAAENAGIEVLRLLVEAGADRKAVDSRGDGVAYYLAKNPYLTDAQKQMDVGALVNSVRPVQGPSFKCGPALSAIDRLVCSDGVLAMQDRYLADAYARWLSRKGEEARRDQRTWLARRNKTCGALTKDESLSCLQQSTRTRIRYLQNRLAEQGTDAAGARR